MIRTADVLSTWWQAVRHARASRDEIVAYQGAQLRRLVSHAYRNVPYYRALFDRHGIAPHQVRTVADLALIPVTTRRDLQQTPATELVARGLDPGHLLIQTTSGSSGEPLEIRSTWLEERLGMAFRLRALRDFGLRPTDRRVRVSFLLPHDPRDWDLPQRTLRALGLYRKAEVDCLSAPEEILRRLEELRPNVIGGFPGVICRVAQLIAGGRPTTLRPRLLMTGGEVLTPLMRREITEAFGRPVADHYSTRELGTVAWQCTTRGGGFHVSDDSLIVEVLKDGRPARPGEVGEVVATRLHAFAMPFIRYRLGDLVTRGEAPCPCGAPFSTILTVQGRMPDYFPLANGRLFHPYELTSIITDHGTRWIGQYQLTQERRDRLVLRVVPRLGPTPEEIAGLEGAARETLRPGVEFQVILVPEIPLEVTGKFRVFRSFVASAYDGIDWDRRRAMEFAARRRPHTDEGA